MIYICITIYRKRRTDSNETNYELDASPRYKSVNYNMRRRSSVYEEIDENQVSSVVSYCIIYGLSFWCMRFVKFERARGIAWTSLPGIVLSFRWWEHSLRDHFSNRYI